MGAGGEGEGSGVYSTKFRTGARYQSTPVPNLTNAI